MLYLKIGYVCQVEEVFTGEVSKEDRDISGDSFGIGYSLHAYVLSFGYNEKANANEGYTV